MPVTHARSAEFPYKCPRAQTGFYSQENTQFRGEPNEHNLIDLNVAMIAVYGVILETKHATQVMVGTEEVLAGHLVMSATPGQSSHNLGQGNNIFAGNNTAPRM